MTFVAISILKMTDRSRATSSNYMYIFQYRNHSIRSCSYSTLASRGVGGVDSDLLLAYKHRDASYET